MKKFLLAVMILTMVLTTYPPMAEAYDNSDYDQGYIDGGIVGKLMGELYGKNDFNDGNDNDYKDVLPKDSVITDIYRLSKESTSYKSGFIRGYKKAFEAAYKEGYRNSNLDIAVEIPNETGIADGKVIGALAGEIAGRSDYINGVKSHWDNALPRDEKIIESYDLEREVASYKGGFLKGYKSAFEVNYIMGFRNANLKYAKEKVSDFDNLKYTNVSMSGGEVLSNDGIAKLEIDEGTLYRDNYLSIGKEEMSYLYSGYFMTPATEVYRVMIGDIEQVVFPKKAITLTFQYFGTENGGIYERINGEWIYLPSRLGEETISTIINKSAYKGGDYAVIMDENYKPFNDTMGHWAEDEIDMFSRNHHISGDGSNNFSPDKAMTRGQFISLLDKYYKWSNFTISGNVKKFDDYSILGYYESSFSKAVYLGIINGYSDNTLRPHMPITYEEVEWIMKKILKDNSFQWSQIAKKIEEKKGAYSSGLISKKGNLTKAEAVYLLYSLKHE